jgi:methionine-rich copper-binding protein CopC
MEAVTVNNPPNTTPPTVAITYPPGGYLTAGKVVFNSVASDPFGIASVQYQLNGVNIGSALTAAPYRMLWDSSSVGSGTYTLVAIATDPSGLQTTSSAVTITVDHTPPTVTSVSPAAGSSGVSTASSLTATFSESVQTGSISLVLKDSSGTTIATTVSYDDPTHTATFTHGTQALEPLAAYTATVNATDLAGNSMAAPFSWSFTTANAIANATIWSPSTVPGQPATDDTSAVEVGVKFRSDVAGFISGVRFYKGGTSKGGIHVGHLWTNAGALLASATFTNETSFGWQQVNFATPVAITAGTTYVASYFAPLGEYAADSGYFASSGVNSGPLHALADGVDGGDGVFIYSSSGAFPTQTFASTNYWVDIVFNSSTQDTTPPTVTGEFPSANATNIAQNSAITATFSKPVQATTISFVLKDSVGNAVAGTVSYNTSTNTVSLTPSAVLAPLSTYTATVSGAKDLSGNVMTAPFSWSFTTTNPSAPPVVTAETPAPGSTGVDKAANITATFSKQVDPTTISFVLTDASNNIIPSTISYDNEANVATLNPNSALVAGTTFTATVSGAKDLLGNAMTAPVTWSFTTAIVTTGDTIWSSTATPAVASANDTSPVEVGVKFRSDSAGTITGLRFYKGTANTGTHVGHLWTSAGTLLATATFSGETASGWQQVNFSTPVGISANTTYIASYYAPVGGYAYTSAFFASAGADNAPLHALANGTDGPNGVYLYHTGGGFPTSSYNSTNYWVDVVFSPGGAGPTVVSQTPTPGATGVSASTTVTAVFSGAVQSNTISFVLVDAAGNTVPSSLSYNSGTLTATLTPNKALSNLTTYTATVSGATDSFGNVMIPVSWSFTTFGNTIWSASATPAVSSANDTSAIELGVKFESNQSGVISGIRFYKGSANTGTHVAHLWDSSGDLLATGTFTNESVSGWQQVNFASPIAIAANTIYIASYYAPVGGYSLTSSYFAASGVTNGPLQALSSPAAGGNGVYIYGSGGGFPTNSNSGSNFWVDVVFLGGSSSSGTWTQTSVADFSSGTNSGTTVTNTGGGAVQEAPTLVDDFTGASLGSNWSTISWTSQGGGATSVTTANSIVSIQGAQVLSVPTYVNTALEGTMAFAPVAYQHFGLSTGFASFTGNYWAMFSTGATTNTLFARVNSNGTSQDVSLGSLPSGFHDYKIVPIATGFQFYVDSVLQTTIGITFPSGTAASIGFSDFKGVSGSPLQADWVKVYQFAASATFVSSVFDAGQTVTWGVASWNASIPTGTGITVMTRTSIDGINWTSWAAVSNGGAVASPPGRFIQYEVIFTTTNPLLTAVFDDITFNWS